MVVDSVKREQAVLRLLDEWPWNFGGTVIGGYAIDAYGKPRYSDDIDLVTPEASTGKIIGWLTEMGFKIENYNVPNSQNYAGKTFRYVNGVVTVDLLSGCVRDRDAKVDIPETWIAMNPKLDRLFTLSGSTVKEIPIARTEALWALKLQAGRDQDITDLFSIMNIPVKSKEVRDMFLKLWTEDLANKLAKTVKRTEAQKVYEDSMSRIAMKQTEKSRNDWKRFQDIVVRMIPTLD